MNMWHRKSFRLAGHRGRAERGCCGNECRARRLLWDVGQGGGASAERGSAGLREAGLVGDPAGGSGGLRQGGTTPLTAGPWPPQHLCIIQSCPCASPVESRAVKRS